jgi:hypothetical protein
MSAILQKLPFYDRPSAVQVRGQSISIHPDQLIVWVSLSEIGLPQLHPETPRMPAVLDTGCTHSFVIREQHLRDWAGIHPQYFPRLKSTRVYGAAAPQLAANLWLHANRPGHSEVDASRPPFRLETQPGIAVVPESVGAGRPRLPLIGLRALRWNRLLLTIDGDRRLVSLRTCRRRWFFG